ncbi:response regulator [candidate division TA06 bacterium]|uniref:histidine kinase n=1 Tax=candidate division TA06 bacterium TaxID=2250710 RepID=A0A523USR5_UNCT6|nr:MAG: response regulator [candidate division TA06 bacterium]
MVKEVTAPTLSTVEGMFLAILMADQNQGTAMVQKPRIVPEERRLTILLFRWLIVLTSLLLVIYGSGGVRYASAGCLLAIFFLVSNLALGFVPRKLFSQRRFLASIFALDVALVSLVVHVGGATATDLYLLYFFVMFMALPASSVPVSGMAALSASIVYTLITYWTSGTAGITQASFLIKIPFFFLLAIFGGIISRQAAELNWHKQKNRRLSEELRRQLEKARTSKQKLYDDLLTLYDNNESILNSIDSGVLVMDLDGTVTAFNHGAEKITGLRRDNILSGKAKTNETLQAFIGVMERTCDEPIKRQQIEICTPSGERKTIGISTYPLIHGKRNAVGVIAVFADLTEMKRLKEKVKRTESLALLGEMAACVARGVRRPLSAILDFSDVIYSSTKEEDERKNYAAMILKEANRIDRTVQEILTFSNDTKPQREQVDTNHLLTEVVDSMKAKAQEVEANIIWEPGSDTPAIAGDEDQLKKVFSNLILNSIMAVGSGGNVVVAADRNEEGVVIEITNEGPGIPQKGNGRVLCNFLSTGNTQAGMGLAIALKIVEDHGGTIGLEGEPGKGAKFTVHLPAIKAKSRGKRATAPATPEREAVVLVADDDPFIRDFYKEVLETVGHKVLLATNGAETIRTMLASHVDLLVLDIKMPLYDGIEVMQHMAKINPRVPIIVASGYADLKDDYVIRNSNVIAYLSKPINILEFKTKIQEALRNTSTKREKVKA